MKKAAIFFAEGYEEIEALTVVDLCRRAGIDIQMVSVTGSEYVTSSHQVCVRMDTQVEALDFEQLDMLILPGGMPGTRNLEQVPALTEQLERFAADGKYVCAICAAPSVLGHLGILKGKKACCYPGFEKDLAGAEITYLACTVDGNVITARGMGCAIEFSKAIITALQDADAAKKVSQSVIYRISENDR
ncbi:MAG: DJ-1/PfpI family protein [Lachnospiraceae bacterium]|nr:DJ-1/PfpI family protein [Lachnospiraceae bacterium]